MLEKIMPIIGFIVGLIGASLVAYGAWQVYEPAGYISGGVFALIWSYLSAKAQG